jgi:hypothetical protein
MVPPPAGVLIVHPLVNVVLPVIVSPSAKSHVVVPPHGVPLQSIDPFHAVAKQTEGKKTSAKSIIFFIVI